MQPDLVLSAPIWRKGNDRLKQLKIRVVESDPQSVDDVDAPDRARSARSSASAPQAKRLRRHAARPSSRSPRRRAKKHPSSVLLVLGLGRSVQAFLPQQLGRRRDHAGRRPAADEGPRQSADRAGLRAALRRDHHPAQPRHHHRGARTARPATSDRIAADLRHNAAWKNTKAAKTRRICVSTDNSLLQAMPSDRRR